MADTKEGVLNFIRDHYAQHEKPPSLTLMCKKVDGLSRRKFYEFFKGGVAEACKIAGTPVPADRIKMTSKARGEREEVQKPPGKLAEEVEANEAEAELEEAKKRAAAEERTIKAKKELIELEAKHDPKAIIPYLRTLEPEIVAPFFELCKNAELTSQGAWSEAVKARGQTWEEWGRILRVDGEEPHLKAYVTDVIETFIPKKRLELALGHHREKTYSCTCGKCNLKYEYEEKGDHTLFTCPNRCIQHHGGMKSIYPCPVCKELSRAMNLSYDRSRGVLYCNVCDFEGEVEDPRLEPNGMMTGTFKLPIEELRSEVAQLKKTSSGLNRTLANLTQKRGEEENSLAKLREVRRREDRELDAVKGEKDKERRLRDSLKKETSLEKRKREIFNDMAEFLTHPEMVDESAINDIIRTLEDARKLRQKHKLGDSMQMAMKAQDRLLTRIAGGRYVLKDEAEERLGRGLAEQRREYERELKVKDRKIAAEKTKRKEAEQRIRECMEIINSPMVRAVKNMIPSRARGLVDSARA